VGTLAARLGANSLRLMDAFVLDTKLNVSTAYLRPAFAFGGSCLAKDIQALLHLACDADLDFPLCKSILPSNETHLRRALAAVLTHPGPTVGLAGLVFKPHTDDVRESPAVWLARRILDAGRNLLVFEPEIDPTRLVGANLNFLRAHFPEYDHCLVSWDAFKRGCDLIAAVRPGLIPTAETIVQPVIRLYRVESLCEKTSSRLRDADFVDPYVDWLSIES
jgi:GDP-mannose 6-dehydrogenase